MDDTQRQIQVFIPSPAQLFTPGVITILVLLIAGWALSAVVPGFAAGFLAVSVTGILHGRIWQLVTYPFVSDSIANTFFDCLMVVFAGSAVEREWRASSFFVLWMVVTVICGLLWVIINLAIGSNFIGIGASAGVYGLIATMGMLYRDRRFFLFIIAVEAKYLVLILIGIGILINISAPINLVWILGAPAAYTYIKLRWSLAARGHTRVRAMKQSRPNSFVDID